MRAKASISSDTEETNCSGEHWGRLPTACSTFVLFLQYVVGKVINASQLSYVATFSNNYVEVGFRMHFCIIIHGQTR